MKSLKIGLVDLDTSHPGSWTPILRDLGHEIVGVFDGSTVWPAGYAAHFAQKRDIPRVFENLDEMAEAVDVAIIHACNWDLHVARAEPFVKAGKGVLIDKPLAGNLRDINTLLDWAGMGRRIHGGSSLRFTNEVREYLAQPEGERGRIHTVLAGCAVDDYFYGIHAYALLSSLMGPGAERVRYLGTAVQKLIQVTWKDGRIGLLSIGAQPGYLPFYLTIVTDKAVKHLEADSNKIYRSLLEAVLPYLGGEVEKPPVPLRDLLEAELIGLAARRSWMHHGAEVFLTDLRLDDDGYDGGAFNAEYRRARMIATENFRVY
ncbi:MAG: Gfo/Idh/MocA family oxidoreductase [Anaerolineae bacterium]|nr:Gfo/Idh/MocA family oxidoreductase [Anaerolineae bacterium]